MDKKKLFIGIGAAAAVLAVALIVIFAVRGNKGYRDIVVFDIKGTVEADRAGKTLKVAKDMTKEKHIIYLPVGK